MKIAAPRDEAFGTVEEASITDLTESLIHCFVVFLGSKVEENYLTEMRTYATECEVFRLPIKQETKSIQLIQYRSFFTKIQSMIQLMEL